MNDLKTNNDFNYLSLDEKTAEKLKEKEYALVGIHARYSNEVGKILYEAREELAQHYKGTFEKWYTSLGFKTTNVYSYINAYKYTLELEGSSKFEELEIFKRQPKSLQNEMSKPSAIPEVNQKVFEGDITAHKDYKEIEMHYQQQLKQKDELIANMADSMHDFELHAKELADENEQLKNKPAEVVEKPVIPEDYEKIKQENEQLKQSNQNLQRDLKWVQDDLKLKQTQYQLLESSTAEAKELQRKINSLQSQEKTLVDKMQAIDDFHDLEREFNQFFDTKMAPMRFKGIANHLYATNAVDRIRSMITQAELWAEEMNKILPDKNMKIIEGEIIDD